MKSRRKKFLLCFGAIIVGTIIAFGQQQIAPTVEQLFETGSTSVNAQSKQSYAEYAKTIAALTETRNLKGLVKLQDELDKRWDGSFATKARLVAQIIDALMSYDFGDPSQYDFAIRYTTDLLSRADELPVGLETQLVEKLQSTSGVQQSQLTQDEWRIERGKRLSQLRHLYDRVSNQIDPRFDPSNAANRPVGNVVAPGNYPAGIDPKSIREPGLREKYEAAIEANKLKAERYSQQVELRNIRAELPDIIEKVLYSLFALPPVDIKDLENQMRILNLDQSRKERIRGRLRSIQSPTKSPSAK